MANLYWFIEQILTTFMGLARTRTTNLKGSSWQGKHSNKQIHIENISYFHLELSSIVGETKNTKKKPVENGANWPNNPTVSERGSWSRVRSGQGKKPRNTKRKWSKVYTKSSYISFLFWKKPNIGSFVWGRRFKNNKNIATKIQKKTDCEPNISTFMFVATHGFGFRPRSSR